VSERLLRHGASSRLNHPNLTDISQATDQPPPPQFCLLLPLSLLFLLSAAATRARSQPTTPACFPIPRSTLVAVARTPREKVTSPSRVSQDPANPSWYKIARSGSQSTSPSLSEDGISTRSRLEASLREILVADGHCGTLCRATRPSTNASRVGHDGNVKTTVLSSYSLFSFTIQRANERPSTTLGPRETYRFRLFAR